jgi:hypothetical protein
MAWRYMAFRAIDRAPLDLDLPLKVEELGWALNGAGPLRATVDPDIGNLRADDGRLLLEEWGTLIFAEADGEIRWGGIVLTSALNGEAWQIEAAQMATYPRGMAFDGNYSKVGADPAKVIADLWAHLQSKPDGDLGVAVTGSTPRRIGTAAEPYTLDWWEAPDVGGEIDTLAAESNLDFTEHHRWSGDEIASTVEVHYPRAGTRRTDLAFIQGDNVIEVVTPTFDGDDYANTVIGLGAGEGKGSVHRTTAVRDGRLRRTAVYTAKDVKDSARMDSFIRAELARRTTLLAIDSVTVTNHANAPIGSWALGDDVLIEAVVPWVGDVSVWCRVVAWSLLDENTARLTLIRSDTFAYGG